VGRVRDRPGSTSARSGWSKLSPLRELVSSNWLEHQLTLTQINPALAGRPGFSQPPELASKIPRCMGKPGGDSWSEGWRGRAPGAGFNQVF